MITSAGSMRQKKINLSRSTLCSAITLCRSNGDATTSAVLSAPPIDNKGTLECFLVVGKWCRNAWPRLSRYAAAAGAVNNARLQRQLDTPHACDDVLYSVFEFGTGYALLHSLLLSKAFYQEFPRDHPYQTTRMMSSQKQHALARPRERA